jgi:hypothetical protein
MLKKSQLKALFKAIDTLEAIRVHVEQTGDGHHREKAAFLNVLNEKNKLEELNQRLVLGFHKHNHGHDDIVLLVQDGAEYDIESFAENFEKDDEGEEYIEEGSVSVDHIHLVLLPT